MATETVNYILNVDADDAEKGLDDTAKKARVTSSDLKKLGLAAAGVGTAFVAFQKSVVDMVNNLNDLSVRSGLATDQIQTLETAFVASGQSAGAAVSLLSRFPAILNSVARGTGEAAEMFEMLGVAATDQNGRLRNSSEIFSELIAKIESIENPTEKAAAAVGVFGRQGAALVQALGAGEFDDFQNFVREYGIQTGPEASRQAAEFQKAIALGRVVTQGLKQDFADLLGGSSGITQTMAFVSASFTGVFRFLQRAISDTFDNLQFRFNQLQILAKQSLILLDRVSQAAGFDLIDEDEARADIERLQTLNAEINTLRADAGKSAIGVTNIFDALGFGFDEFSKSFDAFQAAAATSTSPLEIASASMSTLADVTESASEKAQELTEAIDDVGFSIANLPELALDPINSSLDLFANNFDRILGAGAESFGNLAASLTGENLAASNVAQFAGAGLSRAAGLAGPISLAVVEGIKALGALGAKTPEEIREEAKATTRAIVTGLEILPEILINVLPVVLGDLIIALIFAIGRLPENIFLAFKSSLDNFLENPFQGLQESINNFRLFEFMGGGRLVSAQGGIRFTGRDRGLAMLHEGEFVVPQSGQAPQQVRRRLDQGNQGPQIVINGALIERNAVDSIVRRIEERFGAFGSSSSTLFGGV